MHQHNQIYEICFLDKIESWEVEIFIISFELIDFFSVNKQIAIITIVMKKMFSVNKQIAIITITVQTQAKFCLYFIKTNTKLISGAPKFPLIPEVSPSPKIKKLFL